MRGCRASICFADNVRYNEQCLLVCFEALFLDVCFSCYVYWGVGVTRCKQPELRASSGFNRKRRHTRIQYIHKYTYFVSFKLFISCKSPVDFFKTYLRMSFLIYFTISPPFTPFNESEFIKCRFLTFDYVRHS